MKNKHILNLKQVVPSDIRLEVYKEALKYISTNKKHKSGSFYYLCLLLPALLWDLDAVCADSPDNKTWMMSDISTAFPELTFSIIENLDYLNNNKDKNRKEIKKIRILFLNEAINSLTNK